MMLGVADAIKHRIAQPHVGRAHVDLRAQRSRAIGKFARLHPREQIEIFLDRSIAKRAFLPEPAIFIRFLRRHVTDVGLAFAHELDARIRRADRNNRRRRTARRPGSNSAQPSISQWTSAMMESTYSVLLSSGSCRPCACCRRRRIRARCRNSGKSTWHGRCADNRSARGETVCESSSCFPLRILRHDIADKIGWGGSIGRRCHVAGEATEQDVD